MQGTKDKAYELLREMTAVRTLGDTNAFQATYIADKLHVSRSTASSYLNALYAEGALIKVASRPALFFDRETLERRHGIEFSQCSFISFTELVEYISRQKNLRYDFQDLPGADGSLKAAIKQVKASACYPPCGLPFLISGDDAEGKEAFRRAVNRWCVSEGIVRNESAVCTVDVAHLKTKIVAGVDDPVDDEGVFNSIPRDADLVWVLNCQLLSDGDWRKVFAYFDEAATTTPASQEREHSALARSFSKSGHGGARRFRLFFDCQGDPASQISAEWMRRIPVNCHYPSFSERAVDEREACVYGAFQKESRRIGRDIQISANVVKLLVGASGENDTAGLHRIVQMACANAMASSSTAESVIKVYGAHVPIQVGAIAACDLDEDPSLIDVNTFDPLRRSVAVLEALARFLEVLGRLPLSSEPSQAEETQVFQCLSGLFELVSNKHRAQALGGMDAALAGVVERVFERSGLAEPVGFVARLSDIMAFFRENRLAMAAWRRSGGAWSQAHQVVQRHYAFESSVVSNLSSALRDYWGWRIEDEGRLLLAFYLHWCTREQKARCAAVIVAHGYSTASSIADAVNTVLRQHVFDAIDMPLDVSAQQIEESISRYVLRAAIRQDLLIMVDMGSLEAIGDRLNFSLQVDVGVIDNVSTATALEAGTLILQQKPVSEILPAVSERAVCTWSLHRSEQVRNVVLFVSENGIAAASRLAELFLSSLPKSIDVEALPCEYLSIGEQVVDGMYQGMQVLFVLGTNDPKIPGVNFMLLENLVDMSEEDEIGLDLGNYLAPDEMRQLRANLVKNFTLENIMRHLTILEPDHLMDVVTTSIELLQRNLGMPFPYRMLMRLYVHISYLVERLVTRRYIEDIDTVDFEREQAGFIANVQASFLGITAAYGVDLPMSEIHYVYNLINFEEPEGGDDQGDFFDVSET